VNIAGFPYTEWRFDSSGALSEQAILPDGELTDIMVMSHGWNNAPWRARKLYEEFFAAVRTAADASGHPMDGFAVVGVQWPSMRWPDEAPARAGSWAAGVNPPAEDGSSLMSDLRGAFPDQAGLLEEMLGILADSPDDPAALRRFHELLAQMDVNDDAVDAVEDHGEDAGLLAPAPDDVFTRFELTLPRRSGPAAGGGGSSGLPWGGAREALRAMTYYQMKKRAGVVGTRGLGPALTSTATEQPGLRFHLIGHSFGARLVSYTLMVLPEGWTGIQSILLVQGAFSHHAFAASLPQDPGRSGALAGLQWRVQGPIYVTHSRRDMAVGVLYPRASWLKRDDAAGLVSVDRWGAMGYDGVQGVDAEERTLEGIGTRYPVEPGTFVNLDANKVITKGKFPSGAHSDFCHPEVGWALLRAAGVGVRV
jgi:hypothetical protein